MAKKVQPPSPELREAPLSIRIKPSVKLALDKAAEADRRSVSAMAEMLLEEILKAKGFLK
ncbi:MAG: hypothetical protein ABSD11_17665 [Methylocella sp.]